MQVSKGTKPELKQKMQTTKLILLTAVFLQVRQVLIKVLKNKKNSQMVMQLQRLLFRHCNVALPARATSNTHAAHKASSLT